MLQARHRLRNGFIVAAVALVLIAIPLAWHGVEQFEVTVRSVAGAPIVREWIGPRDLAVVSWSMAGDRVTINLAGRDTPPDAAPLAASLARAFGSPVDLQVTYVHAERQQAIGTP